MKPCYQSTKLWRRTPLRSVFSKSPHKTSYPARHIRIMLETRMLPSITFLHICRSQFIQHSRIRGCAISLCWRRSLLQQSQEALLVLGGSFVRSPPQFFSIPRQLLKELAIARTRRGGIKGFKCGERIGFLCVSSLLLSTCLPDRLHRYTFAYLLLALIIRGRPPY